VPGAENGLQGEAGGLSWRASVTSTDAPGNDLDWDTPCFQLCGGQIGNHEKPLHQGTARREHQAFHFG
jgi:hypothetical protein